MTDVPGDEPNQSREQNEDANLTKWLERPRVESTLLNPALIGLCVAYGANGYENRRSEGMPWVLAFLIPPLVLHRPTRLTLPRDTRTHFVTWTSRNPLLIAGFPRRAAAMTEPTREGIRMAMRGQRLEFLNARLHASGTTSPPNGELGQLLKAAQLIGRWFAGFDQPSTALALLGVRP